MRTTVRKITQKILQTITGYVVKYTKPKQTKTNHLSSVQAHR